MEAAQCNTQLDNAWGLISMDDIEKDIAESIAKARGEALAQYHAGYEVGYEAGYNEGLKLGIEEANQEVVKIMLQNNESIETIISYTGLSREYILSVKQ